MAKGLATFVNSTVVDSYFRQFNGHTQVNATDLRSLKYPTITELERLGREVGDVFPEQNELDRLVNEVAFNMSEDNSSQTLVSAKRKIEEALSIIKYLGFPRAQQNERSALSSVLVCRYKPAFIWLRISS
ncbi:MAG: hypothetical protein M3362_04740 [Acidobacteriota bacterium]|nr:hypothetical protein [Acidobacteriota bacterium]